MTYNVYRFVHSAIVSDWSWKGHFLGQCPDLSVTEIRSVWKHALGNVWSSFVRPFIRPFREII